jgi:hypothetical protein
MSTGTVSGRVKNPVRGRRTGQTGDRTGTSPGWEPEPGFQPLQEGRQAGVPGSCGILSQVGPQVPRHDGPQFRGGRRDGVEGGVFEAVTEFQQRRRVLGET